ncbi:MAG TPA: glycoside hydrolase family 2 TIM barrel-domain containing protein [Draconibacterium sp.]|nr:glycoside hydrolase family 2 TIM barrel-domain containing protein [Draconibacterium sp.]
MKSIFYFAVFFVLLFTSCTTQNQQVNRDSNFNDNWKFIRADVENAQTPAFDDSSWRILDLPHDYSIEDLPEKEGVKQIGPFSEESAGRSSTGHVVGGTAWYRKHFTLDNTDEGKIIQILFDGVYMNADVWINGHHLGNHPYGYTAFAYDLSDFLNPPGQENVLAVQVKNEGKNSRWYSGSGIYRNVKLIKTNPVHIALWGVYITTPEVTTEKATVSVDVKLVNESKEDKDFTLKMKFLDTEGREVIHFSDDKQLSAGADFTFDQSFEITAPGLWSIENPNLYSLVAQLWDGNKLMDETREKFGIRSIDFSPEKGFLLNGENVLLKGGCAHHDNGILGSAAFETAEYRRVKIMKENGFNSIRTSHNPPSKAFLDACDELGMLVMDESFDQWQRPKNPEDYNLYFDNCWEKDLESMVLRDRNHPSIIIWSIGNEINERADSSGLEIARNLKEKILSIDKSRPVTQAICHFWDHPGREWDQTAPAFAQMDVHGYNYQWKQYVPDHEKYPERIMIGTESFPLEAFDNWQMVKKYPYVIGDFVWTGWDYLGESGIGHTNLDNEPFAFSPPWPWFNAYCGDISILGYKKPQMFYRNVVWHNSELEMLVHAPVPEGIKEVVSMWGWPEEWKSWNWEGNEGKPMKVSVYSSCDQIRLELNVQVLGIKDVPKENSAATEMNNPMELTEVNALTAVFEVPYQAGELVAVGLKNGQEVTRQSLRTAEKPSVLKISAEKVKNGVNDLAYFNVEVLDENGILVPNAVIPVDFEIQGDGKLQAVGNGNPTDMKSFQQPHVKTFRGKCQLIVRMGREGGQVSVSAKSEGLVTGTTTI